MSFRSLASGSPFLYSATRWDQTATTSRWHVDALCKTGDLDRALELALSHVSLPATVCNKVCLSLLKACHKARSFPHVKTFYDHLTLHRRSDIIDSLKADLIVTLAKCGAVEDAHRLLLSMPSGTVQSWTAVIAGYVDGSKIQDAFSLYTLMQREGVKPDEYTYVALFKACGRMPDFQTGTQLHTLARREGYSSIIIVGNTLVRMYGKFGSVEEAENVFMCLNEHDIVSWNAMLSVFVENQYEEKTLQLYRQLMEQGNVSPNAITFLCAIQACGTFAKTDETEDTYLIEIGLSLHADIRKRGVAIDVYVGSALQSMYGKLGMVLEAENVFTSLFSPNLVTWNSMLSAYVEGGEATKALQLYRNMLDVGKDPNHQSFVIALHACSVLNEKEGAFTSVKAQPIEAAPLKIGQALHEDVTKTRGFNSNSFVLNALVTMYGRCGSLLDAEAVFKTSLKFDVVFYNAMLSAYVEQGQADRALKLYRQLQEENIQSDNLTFVITLQACGIFAENDRSPFVKGEAIVIASLEIGCALHADAKRKGFASNTFIKNTLISMYGKCGSIKKALDVFNMSSERNVVTWNAMLSVFVDQNAGAKALQLFCQMPMHGQRPNKLTYVLVLQACGMLSEYEDRVVQVASLQISKALHALVKVKGLLANLYIGCTLINMYGKFGNLNSAESVFDEMPPNKSVPWNALLSAYVEQDEGDKVLDIYREMRRLLVTATNITLICVLQACGTTGCLEMSRRLHFVTFCCGFDFCPVMVNTIIFAYSSCADIIDAMEVFNNLPEQTVISWNACIAGSSCDGNCDVSVQYVENLQLSGGKPDEVTSLSLLTAFSHAGLVDLGFEYFESLRKVHELTLDLKHFSIMIDLFGRAGALKVVKNILGRMTIRPNHSIWLSVLGSCRTHGDVKMGEYAFEHAVQLQPMDTAQYILMANIYSEAGLQEEAQKLPKVTFWNEKIDESDWKFVDDEEGWKPFLAGALDHKHLNVLSECYSVG